MDFYLGKFQGSGFPLSWAEKDSAYVYWKPEPKDKINNQKQFMKYTYWQYLKDNGTTLFIGLWILFIGMSIFWVYDGAEFSEILPGYGIFGFVTIVLLVGRWIQFKKLKK